LKTLREALAAPGVLISDGGLGTELQKLGIGSALGEEWNLAYPERIQGVHQRYLEAGSRLITANTFSANPLTLARHGLAGKMAEFNRAGVAIARAAVAGRGWVAGDVGPCGDLLKPLGKMTLPELEESLRAQIGVLLEAGVDGILIETMTALAEVRAGIQVARELGAPCVIATCAFDPFKVGPRTNMGVSPEQFAKAAVEAGADAIGANCGKLATMADFNGLIDRFRAVTDLPLMIQPNGGTPTLQGGKFVYTITPEAMGELLAKIAERAKVVGGCCGTNPEHIRAFRERLPAGSIEPA
jgi:5-methyltetrahydrofolate--homocysteine methyltransferase